MEPIPETAAFIDEFGVFYDGDLLAELRARADAARDLVPDLVGVTVGALEDGVAFTLVATELDVAVLDAIQYVVGGPCVDAPTADDVMEYDSGEVDDERQWHRFSRATSAKAVASTLTLPIMRGGTVVGTVNLYAASAGAFGGVHAALAAIFDAWAPGAVTNADLSFRTRAVAEQSPQVLRAVVDTETAVGMLMAAESVTADEARRLLEAAAQRAGVPVDEVARILVTTRDPDDA